ncbi:hypothetical protein GCM10009682_35390 [Luedemannella flava]|uniref:Uncharacterized protein n=1 Tax=Luedemannella flava TaxID=349316 RepID=A0ABN2M6N2_9ACTN
MTEPSAEPQCPGCLGERWKYVTQRTDVLTYAVEDIRCRERQVCPDCNGSGLAWGRSS